MTGIVQGSVHWSKMGDECDVKPDRCPLIYLANNMHEQPHCLQQRALSGTDRCIYYESSAAKGRPTQRITVSDTLKRCRENNRSSLELVIVCSACTTNHMPGVK